MIEKIIEWSIRNKVMVILATLYLGLRLVQGVAWVVSRLF